MAGLLFKKVFKNGFDVYKLSLSILIFICGVCMCVCMPAHSSEHECGDVGDLL